MAHYAYLNESNVVIDVIVGKDETELIDGLDTETYYGAVRTSYNAATNGFRKNYAGVGYTYDAIRDAFIAPKPTCHPDLITLDEATCRWQCGGIHETPSV